MRRVEGRGFLVRCGLDTPYAGWISASQLDHHFPIQAAPWLLLRSLGELVRVFPGGLSLIWDIPVLPLTGLPLEARAAFWSALGHLPGLSLHVRDEAWAALMDGPIHGWFHAASVPTGAMGLAWRQGLVGWVPEPDALWSLPGLGNAGELTGELAPGCLWGEVVLPLSALGEVGAKEIANPLADAQARMEQDLSLRMSAQAWPASFPFLRRRTAWRVAVLGGKEYRQAGGTWEEAAERLSKLRTELTELLRTPVFIGSSNDFTAASALGQQVMRDGLPWRSSLPLPPESPTFTPGLGSDPRDPTPLETRAVAPAILASVLDHPPVALLRIPRTPGEAAIAAFLRGLPGLPAIRWIPPDIPPPGPYTQERPWAPMSAFPPLFDVSQALQQGLFDGLE